MKLRFLKQALEREIKENRSYQKVNYFENKKLIDGTSGGT